jgi:anti-anti-sigma factor
MELGAARDANVLVIELPSRIDHQNADAFRKALEPHLAGCRSGGDSILFDLTRLEYISSAGLRVLMLASRQTRPEGGRMAVAGARPIVREIFEITRFNQVFPMHGDVSEARAALAAGSADAPAQD